MKDGWNIIKELRGCNPDEHPKILGKSVRHYYFTPGSLETLRKKLIEAFMDYYDRYLKFQIDENPDRNNYEYDIKKTINKLFGVEK